MKKNIETSAVSYLEKKYIKIIINLFFVITPYKPLIRLITKMFRLFSFRLRGIPFSKMLFFLSIFQRGF